MSYKVDYKIVEIELNNGDIIYHVYDGLRTGSLTSSKTVWGGTKQEIVYNTEINWRIKDSFKTYSEAELYVENLIGKKIKSEKTIKTYSS